MTDKAVQLLLLLTLLALLLAGWLVLRAPEQAEADRRNLDLALSILRHPPEGTAPEVRHWAIDTLSRLSDVPLGEQLSQELMGTTLPGAPGPRDRTVDCRGGRTEQRGPWLYHQELWWESRSGELVARGVTLLELCRAREHGSMTDHLLLELADGRRLALSHTILPGTGTAFWRLDDPQTGWRADLRIVFGWSASDLKDYFNQLGDHFEVPGSSFWASFRAAGQVHESAILAVRDRSISMSLTPLQAKLADGAEGQALRDATPAGLLESLEAVLPILRPGSPGEGSRLLPRLLLAALGTETGARPERPRLAVRGGPRARGDLSAAPELRSFAARFPSIDQELWATAPEQPEG